MALLGKQQRRDHLICYLTPSSDFSRLHRSTRRVVWAHPHMRHGFRRLVRSVTLQDLQLSPFTHTVREFAFSWIIIMDHAGGVRPALAAPPLAPRPCAFVGLDNGKARLKGSFTITCLVHPAGCHMQSDHRAPASIPLRTWVCLPQPASGSAPRRVYRMYPADVSSQTDTRSIPEIELLIEIFVRPTCSPRPTRIRLDVSRTFPIPSTPPYHVRPTCRTTCGAPRRSWPPTLRRPLRQSPGTRAAQRRCAPRQERRSRPGQRAAHRPI